jgi:hypothetical protein
MLEWGNDSDGFNISEWTKCGTIADSGVVQSPTPSKWDKPQQVDSGGLTYHFPKLHIQHLLQVLCFRNCSLMEEALYNVNALTKLEQHMK